MLNPEELNKLLNDLKIFKPQDLNKLIKVLKNFARLHRIVRDEDNSEKRRYASLIVEDMFSRFVADLEELKERAK